MISKTTKQHYDKYEGMFQEAKTKGWLVDKLAEGITSLLPRTQAALDSDPHLNKIPLAKFDAHYWVMRRHFPTASLAENTCLLKHALLYHVMGCEFEEEK